MDRYMEEEVSRIFFSGKKKEDKDDFQNRPITFDDFIGQERQIQQLKTTINASNKMETLLEHILLTGPPGLGKTTLARLIANEKGVRIIEHSGPTIRQPFEIINILLNIIHKDILFIDEIHRLDKSVEEVLQKAMEDFKVNNDKINRFTLIGATTIDGMLSKPFKNRFGIVIGLRYYSIEDIQKIIERSAGLLNIQIDNDAVKRLSACSRQTPRIANRLLRRVRDGVVSNSIAFNKSEFLQVTIDDVEKTLRMEGIDDYGLDDRDRDYLQVLANHYPSPVGLKSIASTIAEAETTIQNHIESYLFYKSLIHITNRGRMLTPRAIKMERYGLGEIIRENYDGKIPNPDLKYLKTSDHKNIVDIDSDSESLPFETKRRRPF